MPTSSPVVNTTPNQRTTSANPPNVFTTLPPPQRTNTPPVPPGTQMPSHPLLTTRVIRQTTMPTTCFPNPCSNGGECNLMDGGIMCTCRDGFEGKVSLNRFARIQMDL